MLLAALTLLSFFFTVKVPGIPAKISVSETFVFTSVLLFGTAAATVTVALDALIMSGWRHRREPLKVLFNTTEPALSIFIASHLFFLIVQEPLRVHPRDAGFADAPYFGVEPDVFFFEQHSDRYGDQPAVRTRVVTVYEAICCGSLSITSAAHQ